MGYAHSIHQRAGPAHAVPFSHVVQPMHTAGEAVYEAGAAVGRLVMRLVRGAQIRSRKRSAVAALASLDDRTLRDIGISRADIGHIAHSLAHDPKADYRTTSR